MAAPISSSQYLDTYLTARAGRADRLQTELNDLRVENKFLRAMLAEERMKNGELKASTEARISYFKSLLDPMTTPMRTDDALGREVRTDQRKRRRVDDSDAISISDEEEEEPAHSSNPNTVIPTTRPSQDTSRQKTPTSSSAQFSRLRRGFQAPTIPLEEEEPTHSFNSSTVVSTPRPSQDTPRQETTTSSAAQISRQRRDIRAPTTPLELSKHKESNSSTSTRDDTGANSTNVPRIIVHQRNDLGHHPVRASHARGKSARGAWDHHWQLSPLCDSITEYRLSQRLPAVNSNHKFQNLAIPPAANGLFPPVGDFNIFSTLSVMKTSDFKCLRTNALYHPHAPKKPGDRGVLFGGSKYETSDVENDEASGELRELVVREEAGMWRYFGTYRIIKLERVGRAEWNAVNKDVRQDWACYFASNQTGSDLSSWAAAARDLNREPNEVDIKGKALRKFGRARADEIMTEWNKGRALPFAWGLQCVGYNEAYHNEAHRAVERWEEGRRSRRMRDH